jgi:predicted DNA-binding protein (MmcQ/YjbR family)
MKAKGYEKALQQVRALCLILPETREVLAWGHPTFRAGKKMFAGFGQDEEGLTLGVKVGFDRQDELLKDDRFYPTPYAARQGWVSIRIDGKTDWEEIGGLIREAYRQVAILRMLKTLDEQDK